MFDGTACGFLHFTLGALGMKRAFWSLALLSVCGGKIFAQEPNPTAREFYRLAGQAAEAEQKIRFLERAVQVSPQYLEARLELGKTLVQAGKPDQARAQLEAALDLDAQNAEVWYWKGRAYHALGDTATAARSYRRALKRNPNLAEAKIYLNQIAIQPKLEALYQTAEQARQAGDWRGAAEAYQKILADAPDFKEAAAKYNQAKNKIAAEELASSAETLRWRQQFDEALGQLEQAIVLDPERELELRERMRRITREKKIAENKKPAPTVDDSTTLAKADTIFEAANKDSGKQTETASAPKDSLRRQIVSPPSNQARQNFPTVFLLAAGAIILIVIGVFIFWRQRRAPAPPEPSPVMALPPANDAEKSASLRRTAPINSSSATPPRLERYRFEEELGRGGMGKVFKAYDRKLERPVAVKLIRLDNTVDAQQDEERAARFRREAKAIARLNHPNIVSLYDYDESEGTLYMVMEYVEGQSLEQMLNVKRRLGPRVADRIIKQACLALDYAHKNGVIHRDLKPSNIMVNTEEVVKVVDFGVAKMLAAKNTQMPTLTGMRLGSPFYMSPEQIDALELDTRSDIFSLGAVFYEMLAGHKPFELPEGNSLSSLFYAILHNDPPRLETIPSPLEKIVLKMLAKDREQRFARAREVIEALSALQMTEK